MPFEDRSSIITYINRQADLHQAAAVKYPDRLTKAGLTHSAHELALRIVSSNIAARLDIENPETALTFELIIEKAAWRFETTRPQIRAPGGQLSGGIVTQTGYARYATVLLASRLLGWSLTMIARQMGDKDHTTISQWRRKGEALLREDRQFLATYKKIEQDIHSVVHPVDIDATSQLLIDSPNQGDS